MAVRPVPFGAGALRAPLRTAALALALLVPAALAPGIASAAPATSAEVALARTQDRIEAVSARLAAARAEAWTAGAEEGAEIARLERRLQLQKDRLAERERVLSGVVGRQDAGARRAAERRARAADREVDEAAEEAAAGPATAPAATAPAAAAAPVTAAAAVPLGGDAAQRIDAYLASKSSPLTGLGAVFVAEAGRVGMDPRFLVAIAGSETSFGTYGPAQEIHNPFGLGPHIPFGSWEEAIAYAARTLSGQFYVGEGRYTIAAIQQRWAPVGAGNDPTNLNSNWTRNVGIYYAEQGGDPAAPVFSAEVMAGRPPAPVAVPGGTGLVTGVVTPAVPTIGNSETGPDAAEVAAGFLGRATAAAHPDGLDAAALVRRSYREAGLQVRGDAADLAGLGNAVRPSELRAGDVLVFAAPGRDVATVGLYLGDGAFVYAPADAPRIALASLYEPRFTAAYAGARRY